MVRKSTILKPREALLREEIQFWEDMIDDWHKQSVEDIPDRLRDALAQSMYRLELYLSDEVFFPEDIPPHGPVDNIE